jgi:hypothetical protein
VQRDHHEWAPEARIERPSRSSTNWRIASRAASKGYRLGSMQSSGMRQLGDLMLSLERSAMPFPVDVKSWVCGTSRRQKNDLFELVYLSFYLLEKVILADPYI